MSSVGSRMPLLRVTTLRLEHTRLAEEEVAKHAIGWPHFLERLTIAARGDDPGADPWKDTPPSAAQGSPGSG